MLLRFDLAPPAPIEDWIFGCTLGEAALVGVATTVCKLAHERLAVCDEGRSLPRRHRQVWLGPDRAHAMITLPSGHIRAHLHGCYSGDGWASGSGLLLLIADTRCEATLQQLQSSLDSQTFAFTITAAMPQTALLEIDDVFDFLNGCSPAPRVRAIIGVGAASGVCLAYAKRMEQRRQELEEEAAEVEAGMLDGEWHRARQYLHRMDTRLVLLGSAHVDLEGAAATSPKGWNVLSIHGGEDSGVSVAGAYLFHTKHASNQINTSHQKGVRLSLRVLEGVDGRYGEHAFKIAQCITDWLDGRRRLTDDDLAGWRVGGVSGGGGGLLCDGTRSDLSKGLLDHVAAEWIALEMMEGTPSSANALIASVAALSTALSTTPGVAVHHPTTELDLSDNRLGPLGASALSVALNNAHCPLISLNLARNNLMAGVEALAGALRGNLRLERLVLDGNQVEGSAVALAEALKVGSRLRSLSLQHSGISDTAASMIAHALEPTCSLEALFLAYNRIQAGAASDFAQVRALTHAAPRSYVRTSALMSPHCP